MDLGLSTEGNFFLSYPLDHEDQDLAGEEEIFEDGWYATVDPQQHVWIHDASGSVVHYCKALSNLTIYGADFFVTWDSKGRLLVEQTPGGPAVEWSSDEDDY